ncbi:MAG: YkgJ family cysteine cluster protein [Candidatus Bathyarchaeota archaeon]
MEKIVFKCLRCGHCCQNLLTDVNDELKGLGLTLEETKLFPEKFVSPSYGIGYGGKDGPKHILLYQLTVKQCPHLSEGNLCKIHEERPLACRAFPLESVGPFGTIVEKPTYCRFLEDYIRKHGPLNTQFMTPENFIAPEEWAASSKILEQMQEMLIGHNRDMDFFWSFSLKTNKWEILATIDTFPFVLQNHLRST